ncbi:hypothetical protein [Clostridium saccharoperbutylacetonicum]|uniref:hypothetical protein n=1 Tax=Clostridium saccharoperbutylacetonicum TaxID=36745 RepID=UPI0009839576|nr:hypothetical protein [Clostridium saccharoperbutylacetonicum]AQR95531.1 DNA polymerase III subunit beta [Clostridium saccharoperbutylacetonicum]NSB31391.1 DNA polymerase III sliding clamp (beta) subunit (PCNA family) [Clostridium saccharoperbutylacetonicum]
MKAVVNSESLLLLYKLVKDGKYKILVKGGSVKLIVEDLDELYQVEIAEPYNGYKEDGTLTIPTEVFKLLPKKTSLIIEDEVIKGMDQEIKIDIEQSCIKEIHVDDEKCINIPNFNKLIECKFATAKELTRPVLQCICIDKNNMVALDGYRMSVRSNKENITDEQILIPEPIVKLLRYFTKSDMATIYQDAEHIKICIGWVSIICKRTKELQFINYESLFPKEHTTKVVIDAQMLADVCKKVTKLSNYNHGSDITKFNFGKGSHLITKIQGLEYKKYFKSIKEGNDIEIAVNPKYLVEALNTYKGNVTLYMGTNIDPIIITDDENKKDLVLPIRLMRNEK